MEAKPPKDLWHKLKAQKEGALGSRCGGRGRAGRREREN